MKRISLLLPLSVGIFVASGIAIQSTAQRSPVDPPQATITPVLAMHTAELKLGGKAKMAIFEFDEGHWVYGVIMVKKGKLMEVDVDPITGKVGASETVTPSDEARELSDALSKMTK